MRCPECEGKMEKVEIEMNGMDDYVFSYQCPNCDYYEFEPESRAKVVLCCK